MFRWQYSCDSNSLLLEVGILTTTAPYWSHPKKLPLYHRQVEGDGGEQKYDVHIILGFFSKHLGADFYIGGCTAIQAFLDGIFGSSFHHVPNRSTMCAKVNKK